jgi:glutamyl-Q tRNA(Asp) synthetase
MPPNNAMSIRTRFAPSPTGPLHLGHAESAIVAFELAHQSGGEFLLRIEDIDQNRARPEWEMQIFEDLKWLGLTWPQPIMRQSQNMAAYDAALDTLWAQGMLYVCTCTRRDIQDALSAPQEDVAPVIGPDGVIYPGTCRYQRQPIDRPKDAVLRLNMERAVQIFDTLCFEETGLNAGIHSYDSETLISQIGDVVLARKDMGTSYHLSVVVDDATQGITHVVRGADLFDATAIHVALQRVLDLPTPIYHHHALVRDEAGKRLAKRDDARAISLYRKDGLRPKDVIALSRSLV